MTSYQGRALETRVSRRPRGGRVRRVAWMLALLAVLGAMAHVPWRALRARFVTLEDVRVEGLHYLDIERVLKIAGIRRGQDLWALDPRRARQKLLMHPRIESATVSRWFPHGVRMNIRERVPVMLVRHGQPWEMDSTGVLLSPLAAGAVADVPMLSGTSFRGMPDGARIGTAEVRRGLAWVRSLASSELQLLGQVSEIDVSDARATGLLMMNGTRVLSPAWPPGTRELSALRVVLEDLRQKKLTAREVDLRFHDQVIVRPATPPSGVTATAAAEFGHGT